jgi:hypothetical protein
VAEHSEIMRLLAKRNHDLGRMRARLICWLHNALAELSPGGIAKELYASDANRLPAPTPNVPASSSRCEQVASSIYPVRTSAGKAVPQAALYHGRTWLRSVRAAQRRSIGGSDCARTLTCRSATTASPD